jgi:hypothetical protein
MRKRWVPRTLAFGWEAIGTKVSVNTKVLVEHCVEQGASADRGRLPRRDWIFQIDFLAKGEEYKADGDPYRNLEESMERH